MSCLVSPDRVQWIENSQPSYIHSHDSKNHLPRDRMFCHRLTLYPFMELRSESCVMLWHLIEVNVSLGEFCARIAWKCRNGLDTASSDVEVLYELINQLSLMCFKLWRRGRGSLKNSACRVPMHVSDEFFNLSLIFFIRTN